MIVVLILAVLLRHRRPKAAVVLVIATTTVLYLLSIPPLSIGLSRLTEKVPALTADQIRAFKPQAIVILGGGAEVKAAEYAQRTVPSESSLRRMAYGAYLAQSTKLPILVSGGYGESRQESEGWAMKTSLESFAVPVAWTETESRNTRENALFSQPMLAREKIERILLVTDASHAARARGAFQATGMTVLAAPTGFRQAGPWDQGVLMIVPTASHFFQSSNALRAILAEIWYRV